MKKSMNSVTTSFATFQDNQVDSLDTIIVDIPRSMPSSSANESRSSLENSIINEDTSIDDIFTHLTIPQIQKLNKEYKQNVTNAKNDLHGLVGNKYRDLIKIAEDISSMYAVTSEVDQKLSDLSYGQSKFVSFNTSNSFSKYSSSIRRKEASEARRNEKLTILKNIINNQLVSFEIRLLSSHRRPPLKNTAHHIYYAKCFYTLECIFEDTLRADRHLSDKLAAFKASFASFLEAQLASYNAFSSMSYSNEAGKYKPSQNLVWEDFVNISNGHLVDDDMDGLDEDDDDDDDDEMRLHDTDHNEDSDPEETLHETYNKVSPPIINYLIAYLILNYKNEKTDTLTEVLNKFVKLRYDFLNNALTKILSTSKPEHTSHINFCKIFKYIENTCDYISRYFSTEKPTKNELLKDLKQATGTWKASSLIGFHNWIENENVTFNHDLILIDIYNSDVVSLDEFPRLLARFCDNLIKQISNDSKEGIDILSNSLVIFHNFIISLKKLDVSMIGNGSNSKLIELLSNSSKNNSTITTSLLKNVISKTNHIYTTHFDTLSCKSKSNTNDNILSIIKSNIANKTFKSGTESFELFSSDLVEIIDTDLNKYIDLVAQISSLPSLSAANHDVCHRINIWFDTYLEYADIINFSKEFNLSRLTARNCLSHLSEVLSRSKTSSAGKWGDFSRELMLKEFEALATNFSETLYNKIDDIIEEIGILISDSENNNDVEISYYLLRVLLTLFDRLVSFDKNQNDRVCKAIAALHASCKDILSNIVKKIPYIGNGDEPPFMESFDKFVTNLFSTPNDALCSDLPNRPSLRLSSLLFYLSSMYLTPFNATYAKDCDYGKLFMDQNINKIFTELKREWILEDLIQKNMIDKLPSFASNTDNIKDPIENKDETSSDDNVIDGSVITKEKYLLVFANVVYLLQFANGAPINDVTNSLIQDHVKKLNTATGNEIDEPSMKHVIKNVSEFYKSNKGIYLALSIS